MHPHIPEVRDCFCVIHRRGHRRVRILPQSLQLLLSHLRALVCAPPHNCHRVLDASLDRVQLSNRVRSQSDVLSILAVLLTHVEIEDLPLYQLLGALAAPASPRAEVVLEPQGPLVHRAFRLRLQVPHRVRVCRRQALDRVGNVPQASVWLDNDRHPLPDLPIRCTWKDVERQRLRPKTLRGRVSGQRRSEAASWKDVQRPRLRPGHLGIRVLVP